VDIRLRRIERAVARCAVAAGCAAVTGCTAAAAEPPEPPAAAPPAAAPPAAAELPASAAGGACQLLDYAAIEASIKVRFDVAAASQQGRTFSCVVQRGGASRPDLMLAVTATTADPATFRSTMAPEEAQPVAGLGAAAYRAALAGGGSQGPGVEVGWLSADKRLLTLRFTFAPGAGAAAVNGVTPQLVDLAKKIDKVKPG
jgi:hypothetical protein